MNIRIPVGFGVLEIFFPTSVIFPVIDLLKGKSHEMSANITKSISRNRGSVEDTICIIKSSDYQGIRTCAVLGIAVLTPNPFMQPELIVQTILNMNKRRIFISADILEVLKGNLDDIRARKLGLRVIPLNC